MRKNIKFIISFLFLFFLSVNGVNAFGDDNKFENDNIFAPWNDPLQQDDIFAPWNDPLQQDDMFAPWNNILSNQQDTNDYLRDSGVDDADYYWD